MSDCASTKTELGANSHLETDVATRKEGDMQQKQQQQQQDRKIESAAEPQGCDYASASPSVKVMEEIDLVLHILRKKIEDESFVHFLTNEITVFALVANSNDSVLNIRTKDGLNQSDIRPLIDILQRYASNELVQRDGLRELQRLVERSHDCRVAVAKEGAIELVIQAMTKFPKNSELQRYGCLAFGNLSYNNQENAKEIGRRGGIPLVIRALTIHQRGQSQELLHQRDVFYALGNLAVQKENRSRIARRGGIELMIQSMKKFAHDSLFQRHGCVLLGNLALEDDNEIAIARQGGIVLIIQALSKHKNNDQLQRYGLFALVNVSVKVDHVVTIAENGGVISVLEAMRKYPRDEKIQEYGSWVLSNMSRVNYDHHYEIGKNGGLELAISTMQRFPSNICLQRSCFCVLGNLASKELEKHACTCVSLAMNTLLDAPKEEEEDSNLREPFACYALEAWAVACPECQPYIVSLGGVTVARNVWKGDLDEVDREALLCGLSSLADRFIFDHEFLSQCGED